MLAPRQLAGQFLLAPRQLAVHLLVSPRHLLLAPKVLVSGTSCCSHHRQGGTALMWSLMWSPVLLLGPRVDWYGDSHALSGTPTVVRSAREPAATRPGSSRLPRNKLIHPTRDPTRCVLESWKCGGDGQDGVCIIFCFMPPLLGTRANSFRVQVETV